MCTEAYLICFSSSNFYGLVTVPGALCNRNLTHTHTKNREEEMGSKWKKENKPKRTHRKTRHCNYHMKSRFNFLLYASIPKPSSRRRVKKIKGGKKKGERITNSNRKDVQYRMGQRKNIHKQNQRMKLHESFLFSFFKILHFEYRKILECM